MEAPDGQGVGSLWTARAISARACRVRRSLAAWASSPQGAPAQDRRDVATQGHRRALPARPPL